MAFAIIIPIIYENMQFIMYLKHFLTENAVLLISQADWLMTINQAVANVISKTTTYKYVTIYKQLTGNQ